MPRRPTSSREARSPCQPEFGLCHRTAPTPDAAYYSTTHKEDAREWKLDRDLDSVWSSHPYHLELHVYDNNRREFSRTRVYKFDLKKRLDADFYRRLKLRLFERETTNHPYP